MYRGGVLIVEIRIFQRVLSLRRTRFSVRVYRFV